MTEATGAVEYVKGSHRWGQRFKAESFDENERYGEDLPPVPDVEAIVIALPLHLHAPVAIEAMRAGKHVLTEKLMGKTVAACWPPATTRTSPSTSVGMGCGCCGALEVAGSCPTLCATLATRAGGASDIEDPPSCTPLEAEASGL